MTNTSTEATVDLDQITVYFSVVYHGDQFCCIYFRTEEDRQKHAEEFRERNKRVHSAFINVQDQVSLAQAVAEYERMLPGYMTDPRILFPDLFPEVWAEHEARKPTRSEVELVDDQNPQRNVRIITHGRRSGELMQFEFIFSDVRWPLYLGSILPGFDQIESELEKRFTGEGEKQLSEADQMFIRKIVAECNRQRGA